MNDGQNNFKHMKQQASLLSIMDKQGFLADDFCFIEFGAGKGMLMSSNRVCTVLKNYSFLGNP